MIRVKALFVTFRLYALPVMVILWLAACAAGAQTLVFNDPLTNGTTIGIRDNGQGQFVMGQGWKVTGFSDNIRYTPATPIEDGSVEFDIIGLSSSDNLNPDGQLMNMYDASSGDPRHVYMDVRLNPWKFVWHRYGDDGAQYHEDEFKMIMNTGNWNQYEDYSDIGKYPWNPFTLYHLKVRWKDGIVRYYINGTDTDRWPFVYKEVYRPGVHDIRIATNTRDNAIINAIYSNVKIYDYGTVPTVPYINNPTNGGIVKTLTPVVDWTGARHDRYEVHITTSTSPTTGIVWDSGEYVSANSYCTTGTLSNTTAYYAHVRLRNDKGWGSWSAARQFQVDTGGTITVPKFGEYEIALTTPTSYSNPYTQITLSATFTGPTKTITVNGFWDGGNLYKFRMMPTEPGSWSWTTTSNDSQLNGKTGAFTCVDSASRGYVKVSTAYPYTFEWANGTPFFLLGDTTWHMYYNLRYSDNTFQTLIDARSAQHFNYMHGVVHDSPHNEGGGVYRVQKDNPADPGKGIWDCDTLNPAYFQWVDEKIDYMNSKGMVASMFFAWGNEGYDTDYTSSDQWTRYMKYLVARYASKNVIWIIVGEYEEVGEPNSTWIGHMDTVYNNDPYKHPISMHTVNTTNAFGNTTSHMFVSQQRQGTTEQLRSYIATSRVYNKPVVNQEYGYEGDPAMFPANQNANDVRKDHYAICLAGGYGVYGNNVPGYSTYHRTGDFVLTATDTPGAQYMKILYEFFAQTNFHRLAPSQSLVSTGVCAAWTNNEYIVQLPVGGVVNINLSGASGSFYVDWFNPRTGARTSAGTTTGGGLRSFTAPDTNDWILHIHNNVINPPEGSVTNFIAVGGDKQVSLSWTNPSSADFTGAMIRYKTTGYPTSATDGTQVIDKANLPGSNDSYTHTGLTNGATYYYAAFPHNAVPTYGPAANALATPVDVTAPGPVSLFSATTSEGQISLSWRNPSDSDFTATMIRYKTTGYPTSASDGSLLVDKANSPGSDDSLVHTGLLGSTTYYYRAFAHDATPNYNTSFVTASATTPASAVWLNEPFDLYLNGDLAAQGAWTKEPAKNSCIVQDTVRFGVAGKGVEILGTATVYDDASIASFGSITSGYHVISFHMRRNASAANNQAVMEFLDGTVKITRVYWSTNFSILTGPGITFTDLVTNPVSNQWYQIAVGIDVTNKTVDAWVDGVQKVSDMPFYGAAATKINMLNLTGYSGAATAAYIDNLKGEQITTPSAPAVTDDGAYTGSISQLHCSWTPTGTGTTEYRYAIGTSSEGIDVVGWTNAGSSTDATETELALGENQAYYFSVQSGNGYGFWSASGVSNGITTAPGMSVQEAKELPDGQAEDAIALRGKVVSAVFPNCFYVQEPDGCFGIKVIPAASVTEGMLVDLAGVMKGANAERSIDCAGNPLITAAGTGPPDPVGIGCLALGGTDFNTFTPGVIGGIGPNNIGLLVTIWGRITQKDTDSSTYFYIDDGSGIKDGTDTLGVENIGGRVKADPTDYPDESYLVVTGISCFIDGGLARQLLPIIDGIIQLAP
ncbi:MAG: DUF4038 domain-containing protein [Armatimonadota bacterium]|nr:DUF4038 domain-containing protein [Armatimonadota bacterium]